MENLALSLTGRMTHPVDFSFHKNNGELANRARAELRLMASSFPLTLRDIGIDEDGDVEIQTDRGFFYATPVGVVVGGWLTKVSDLAESIQAVSRIVDSLSKLKGSFQHEGYNVRLGFRFTPVSGLELIRKGGFDALLGTVLSQEAPTEIDKIQYEARYKKGDFLDTIELEGSQREIQLRYLRDYHGASYESFGAFLVAADLAGICEDLRVFAENVGTDERPSPMRRAMMRHQDRK